jgi:hypothetical protein
LYDNPEIDGKRLEAVAIKFLNAVKRHLKCKTLDPKFTIEFDHDIFRYIFRDKGLPSSLPGATLLAKNDFERMMLPCSWHYTLNKHGEGHSIEFPVRAKPVLKRSTMDYVINNSGVLVQAPKFERKTRWIRQRKCNALHAYVILFILLIFQGKRVDKSLS